MDSDSDLFLLTLGKMGVRGSTYGSFFVVSDNDPSPFWSPFDRCVHDNNSRHTFCPCVFVREIVRLEV